MPTITSSCPPLARPSPASTAIAASVRCCRRQVTDGGADKGSNLARRSGRDCAALIIHLHVTQAHQLRSVWSGCWPKCVGLTISEGAIANHPEPRRRRRCWPPRHLIADRGACAVRWWARMSTSARVGGKNWWQCVLLGSTAIYHVIADTRAASVVTAFMNGARPEVWVADRYGGQLGHGAVRQMCLAHLLRDATYAIDECDERFALGFRIPAVAGCGDWPTTRCTEGQHPGAIPRRSGAPAWTRSLAGAVPDQAGRATSVPRLCLPRIPTMTCEVRVHHTDATCPTPTNAC